MVNKHDEENTGIHIESIMGSVPCATHGRDIGEACWNIGSNHGILKAICDKRARAAGANGAITPYRKHSGKINPGHGSNRPATMKDYS